MVKTMKNIDNIGKYLEHTLLSPEMTIADLRKACADAKENGFAAVVIRGCFVDLAKELLKGSDVMVCTAVGATTGMNPTKVKVYEAKQLVQAGADELDLYINVGYVKNGMWDEAYRDIKEVVDAVKKKKNIPIKVIVENGIMYESDKPRIYRMIKEAGADYIKTSTGFVPGVATIADVKLIRKTVPDMKIKAASHIYDYRTAMEFIQAGADRIGTTSAMKIIAQEKEVRKSKK